MNINGVINEIKNCKMLKDIDKRKLFNEEDGFAFIVAKEVNEELNTNQLRKFFGAIRKMEQKNNWNSMEPEFYLLKPRMAVGVGRGNVPKPFFDVIMAAMNKVDVGINKDNLDNFKVFVEFFEAIVAYNKFIIEIKGNDKKRNKGKKKRY